MAISPEEQADLDKLLERRKERQDSAFMHFRHILDMGPEELKHSGHKTVEGALIYSVRSVIKENDKDLKLHLKKYPD